ncbi:alpha/beta hydrolase [Caloranaerobacter ferrireducens]|uniref:alpha/beta hydrolase n=1 Tax=Caloranaerobacter ferrireducens TaxID=1323370 RepID=UPI00084D4894|nr:alpha/beta fold hydrolase [Caloranaerobacter ferrireducens]
MKYLHDNAKAFYFRGNNIGCLLIHGFTGSPAEMRLLGEFLNKQGCTVKGVLLKGHGTTVEDMEQTTWKDWLSSAEVELIDLMHKCDKVVVIGLSMGGIIALKLAERFNVDAVVSIAAPIKIVNRKVYFARVIKYFKKYIPKPEKKFDDDLKDYCISYDRTPVAAIPHLLKLIRITKRRLRKIKSPILIIQSKNDKTVRYESAEYIFEKVGSELKKLVYLKESGHVVTLDLEREKVFNEIKKFLIEINLLKI